MDDGSATLRGKVCLITGASAGIGRATALGLARQGATVVIAGRDPVTTAAVAAEVQQLSSGTVTSVLADFSSQTEVRRLAADFAGHYDHLDVLINNAGTTRMRRELTVDGLEAQFAVNHLAPYLLTRLLLPLLLNAPAGRIINVSSDIHRRARMKFDDLQGERHYSGNRAYGQSKLANVLFTLELARRLHGTSVTANAVHPGIVAGSDFGRNYSPAIQPLLKVMARLPLPFLSTPQEAATTSLFLASSPQVGQISGAYFVKSRQVPTSPAAQDTAAQRRLWEISAALTGLPEAMTL